MIEEALSFTQQALNQYLMMTFGNRDRNVVINHVVNDDNSIPLTNQNKIVLSLINVENETTKPFYNRYHQQSDGSISNINPTEKFNLDLLITAIYQDYSEALKFLSSTIKFFQIHSSVSIRSFSFFPDQLEKLEYELVKMNFDKMFNLWSSMGAKYKPSMVYKIKLINIQGDEVITYQESVRQTAQSMLPNG